MSPGPIVAATASIPTGAVGVLEAAPTAVEAGTGQGVGHDRQRELDVRTTCQLGHDAPVPGVQVHLARDDGGDDRPPALDHRRSRLVAGGLDAEDAAAWAVTSRAQPAPDRRRVAGPAA